MSPPQRVQTKKLKQTQAVSQEPEKSAPEEEEDEVPEQELVISHR
jgi:hypothetical protein